MLEQLICDIVSRRILSLRIRGLGRWWQKEVEIRGLDEVSGDALFCECRWSHRRARGTLAARKEKARRDANRIERVALTAEGKEDQREDGYLVADVEDIGRPSQPGR